MGTQLTTGQIVAGRYRLEHLLGEGGMGTVWAATHTVTAQRHALKFLRPRAMGQRHRFLREARAACAVDHPNVVNVQDIFELEDGMPLMVMELLEGESLQSLLHRRRQLDVGELAHIMLPVVSAVGTAHAAGIVHRDLKPENIFLVHSEGATTVKVLDFGIAKLMPSELGGPASPGDTQTGALLGTPHYMSPEQASGERVDHRSDIWSLGIIAYEALSGVLPTRAESVGGVLKIVMTARIQPLRERELALPADIIALVDGMLSERADDRPADLRFVRDALLRHVTDQVPDFGAPTPEQSLSGDTMAFGEGDTVAVADTVQATPDIVLRAPSTTAGTARSATVGRPRRHGAWIAGGVMALALCGASVWWLSASRTVTSEAPAERPKATVPKLGLKAIADYRDRPAETADLVHSASYWESAARDFDKSMETGKPTARRKAELRFARGMSKLYRGKLPKAVAAFRKAAGYDPEWALPPCGLSHALVLLGRNDEALDAAQEAERLDPKWWGGTAAIANVFSKMNKLDDAIETYNRALAKSPENPSLLASLAHLNHADHNDSQAKHFADEALKRNRRMVAPLVILAELALEKDDGGAALEHAARALGQAPRNVAALLAKADALALLQRRDEALAAYREFLKVLDELNSIGVPEDRVALVRKHVAADELPPSRTAAATIPRSRSVQPAPRSRSRPVRPAPSPIPRSRSPRNKPKDRSRPVDNLDL